MFDLMFNHNLGKRKKDLLSPVIQPYLFLLALRGENENNLRNLKHYMLLLQNKETIKKRISNNCFF